MKMSKKVLSVLLLAASVAAGHAQSSTSQKKEKPKTEEQIRLEQMTEKMEQLEQQMVEMKQQLQRAKDAAANAQTAADQAAKKADEVKEGAGQNAQAVSALQGSVEDLKASSSVAVQKVQEDQKKIQDEQKKTAEAIEHPDVLHYKGITLSPNGSFLAGETVDRSAATGGDIPTAWTSIPFSSANLAQTSEFFGSGRQSRIALLAEGRTAAVAYRGYYEADFLVFRHQLQQQPEQQLCASSAPGMGATGDADRVGDQRGTDVVSRHRIQKRFDAAYRSDSVEHRPELRARLRVGTAVRLPRCQAD